jgi:hypothetical protein
VTIICSPALSHLNSTIKHPGPQFLPLSLPFSVHTSIVVATRLVERYLIVVKIDRLAIAVLSNPIPEPIPHALEKFRHAAAVHIVPRNHAPQQKNIDDPPNAAQATREQPDEPSDGVLGVETMAAGEAKEAP